MEIYSSDWSLRFSQGFTLIATGEHGLMPCTNWKIAKEGCSWNYVIPVDCYLIVKFTCSLC